jgi:hypothetical protein
LADTFVLDCGGAEARGQLCETPASEQIEKTLAYVGGRLGEQHAIGLARPRTAKHEHTRPIGSALDVLVIERSIVGPGEPSALVDMRKRGRMGAGRPKRPHRRSRADKNPTTRPPASTTGR